MTVRRRKPPDDATQHNQELKMPRRRGIFYDWLFILRLAQVPLTQRKTLQEEVIKPSRKSCDLDHATSLFGRARRANLRWNGKEIPSCSAPEHLSSPSARRSALQFRLVRWSRRLRRRTRARFS